MTHLGKCLLFYLRYPAEMERLYETDEPNVEGLPDPDQTLSKVELVGDTACREAGELLEACAQVFEEHFRPISNYERKRTNFHNDWQIKFDVAPKRGNKAPFRVGVYLDAEQAVLFPWVWAAGGRRVEDELVRILGQGIKSSTLMWDSGCIAVSTIKLLVPEQLDTPVPCEPILTQLKLALAPFTAETVKAIATVISRG